MELEDSAKLIYELRKELGSITPEELKELEEPQYTDSEMMEVAGAFEVFYSRFFEKVLNKLIHDQLELIGTKAQNENQLMFGRGAINAFYLIKEVFNEKISLSRSRLENKEKPEPGEI